VQRELIARAKHGDREALSRLLSDARPRALAVAMRMMRNPDDAEDVVQDAFMKVLRHMARFEERAAFNTWLHRIVVNTCLDRLRRPEPRRAEPLGDDGDEHERDCEGVNEETPELSLERARARQIVHRALEGLSPLHREAVTLRELEEHSYGEIARIARCPVGTVMSRLFHARRRLAEELAGLGAADAMPEAA